MVGLSGGRGRRSGNRFGVVLVGRRAAPADGRDFGGDPAGKLGARALGVELQGRHLLLLASLLEGRGGQVTLDELAILLRNSSDPLVGEVLAALSPLLPPGGGDR